jgi:hypothetical protein
MLPWSLIRPDIVYEYASANTGLIETTDNGEIAIEVLPSRQLVGCVSAYSRCVHHATSRVIIVPLIFTFVPKGIGT